MVYNWLFIYFDDVLSTFAMQAIYNAYKIERGWDASDKMKYL